MAQFMQMLADDEFIWLREHLSVRLAESAEATSSANSVSDFVLESR
jgi:hypothetical protein